MTTGSTCVPTLLGGGLSGLRPFLQPERIVGNDGKFFIWIRRNPLKSPDSAKEKQGNPS
jgi:hypothetical protein